MSLLAALLLAQPHVHVAPPDPALPPSDPAAVFAVFRRLCFEPFPDPAAFDRAIAAEGPSFVRWQPGTQLERVIPTRVWHAPAVTVHYGSGNLLASLPDPQCSVRASAAPITNPEHLFPLFASSLGLGQGRISGRRRFRQAMWNLARDGQRWRVILGTERRDDRLMLRLSMLNLKPEHR
jgi:hypothetical protein